MAFFVYLVFFFFLNTYQFARVGEREGGGGRTPRERKADKEKRRKRDQTERKGEKDSKTKPFHFSRPDNVLSLKIDVLPLGERAYKSPKIKLV